MNTLARAAFAVALFAAGGTTAFAQAIPPGQSCGGLFCDMGLFGHKVAPGPNGEAPTPEQVAAAEANDPHRLPCHDFFCKAFGQKDAEAAPPPPAPVVAMAEPKPMPGKAKSRKKHVVKAAPAAAAPAPDAPAAK